MASSGSPTNPIAAAMAELNQLQKAIKAIGTTVVTMTAAPDQEPFETLRLIREVQSRITAELGPLTAALTDAEGQLLARAESAADTYAERLFSYLRTNGLDPKGDAANMIVDGIVYVATDRVSGRVTINEQAQADLRIPRVARDIAAVRDHLTAAQLSSSEFAKNLASAYDAEILAEGKKSGDQVRIDAVHRRLLWLRQSKAFLSSFSARAFREYTRDQLRADLYRLTSSGERMPDGRTLALDSGAETSGALWMLVPALGRAGYVGRVRLTKSND